MKDELPDIAKRAAHLAVAIEDAVTRFARKHRHQCGVDLRQRARDVLRATRTAWHDRQRKLQRVHELSRAVDDLKAEIQIADLVKAWGSIAEMEHVGRLVVDFGGRVGGWIKALQRAGQSAPAERRVQRAPILSAHSASSEANV